MSVREFFEKLQEFGAELEGLGLPPIRFTEVPLGRLATLESRQQYRFVAVFYNTTADGITIVFGPENARPVDVNNPADVAHVLEGIRKYLLWEEE